MLGGELAELSERLNQRDVLIWSRCQEGRGALWMSGNALGERVMISLQQAGCIGPFLPTYTLLYICTPNTDVRAGTPIKMGFSMIIHHVWTFLLRNISTKKL